MGEMSAAEWDAAYLQVIGSIARETGYQCREMTYHPRWYWVRCMRPPHDNTHPHMTMVNGVTDSWPDDEPSCVRHRQDREAAERERGGPWPG